MTDEIKELLELFKEHLSKDKDIAKKLELLNGGEMDYSKILEYSSAISHILVDTIAEYYPQEIKSIVEAIKNTDVCREFYNDLDNYVYSAQNLINKNYGLGIKAVKTKRPNQIVEQGGEETGDFGEFVKNLKEKCELASNKRVDTIQQANAKYQSRAGYGITVSRMYDGKGLSDGRTCEWCLDRVGSNIPYESAYRRGMFQRHEGCHCVIEYNNNGFVTTQNSKGGRNSWK